MNLIYHKVLLVFVEKVQYNKFNFKEDNVYEKGREAYYKIIIKYVELYEAYYFMTEEEKENYLKETKFDRYYVNSNIEQEELEKVKVKVKSLTR